MAGAGDVSGDGILDLIIGAPQAGSSYVVFGASGFRANFNLSKLNGVNGFRLNDAGGNDSGFSVAGAGDLNGDGIADVIVGAPGASPHGQFQAGVSYVVFGRTSVFPSTVDLSILDGTAGFRVVGEGNQALTGVSVAGAGDINRDGIDDLVIGAEGADPGGRANAGSSYVVFGKTSGFRSSVKLSKLDGKAGFRLNGVSSGDESGWAVSSAGDVNGDGVADLIIGAPQADPHLYTSGFSYVVFGKP